MVPRLVGTAWEVKLAFLGYSPEPRSGATPPTAAFWLGSSEGTRLERIRYAVFSTAFSPALHSLGIFMQQTAFKRWAQLKEVTESVGFQFDCPAIPPGSTMAWTSSSTMTTVTAMMALLLNRGDIKRCSGGGIASGGGGCGGCGVKGNEIGQQVRQECGCTFLEDSPLCSQQQRALGKHVGCYQADEHSQAQQCYHPPCPKAAHRHDQDADALANVRSNLPSCHKESIPTDRRL